MGKLIVFALTLYSGLASAYPCPGVVQAEPQAGQLQAWMARWQGRMQVGECQVEITACDLNQGAGSSSTIGEIYIVDKEGREAYLPLSWIGAGHSEGKTQLEMYEKRLSYVKYDYVFEDEYGRTEAYRLDMRVNLDTGSIRTIDLGTYATRKKLHMPDGNQSRWYNCKQ